MSVYLELTQENLNTSLISIVSTVSIVSATNQFLDAGIKVGASIRLSGWNTSGNNTDQTVASVSAGVCVCEEGDLTTEGATQVSVSGTNISFENTNQLKKTTGLSVFSAGQKLVITGSTLNNVTVTVKRVVGGTLTTEESLFKDEAAGASVTVKQLNRVQTVDYFSDKAYGVEKSNSQSVTKWYQPGINTIGDVSYAPDRSFTRLKDGSVSVLRSLLDDFNLSNRVFNALLKYSDDSESPTDFTLFNSVAIIQDITNHEVVFKLKTKIPQALLLDQAPDIDTTATFTQNRHIPRNQGQLYHTKPLIKDNASAQFFSGSVYVQAVYDDGVLVPFDGVTTSYGTSSNVDYGDYAYSGNVSIITASPSSAGNTTPQWTVTGASGGNPIFEAEAETFDLLSTPVGEVSIDCSDTSTSFVFTMLNMGIKIGYSAEYTYADSGSPSVKVSQRTQISVIEFLKRVCEYKEHFFFLDDENNKVWFIDKKSTTGTGTLVRDSNSAFPIVIDSDDVQLQELIQKFVAEWETRVPIQNPVELSNVIEQIEVETGNEAGKIEVITPYDTDSSNIEDALDKKVSIQNDYFPFQIALEGIDPNVFPGKMIQFDAGWISGDLLVTSHTWQIQAAKTLCKGIASNVSFS